MEIADHVASLRRDGELLAVAADAVGPDAQVPTCPGWQIRDLVHHVGGVHRWATGYVADRQTEARDVTLADVVGAWPEDSLLVDWFRAGHAQLVATLASADPSIECWTFLPAPSPLAFWARRQAHETAIHRVDAESATGSVTAFAPPFAADGIDEMIFGFAARPGRSIPTDSALTMALHAPDAKRTWTLQIRPDGIAPAKEDANADCEIHASASELYLLLWNRRGPEELDVRGNPLALDLWQQTIRIRWVD